MTIKVQENQTLFDIALQEYGTAEAVFALAYANNISITDILQTDTELTLPTGIPINNNAAEYYKKNNVKPASGTNDKFWKFIRPINVNGTVFPFVTIGNGVPINIILNNQPLTQKTINTKLNNTQMQTINQAVSIKSINKI